MILFFAHLFRAHFAGEEVDDGVFVHFVAVVVVEGLLVVALAAQAGFE